MITFHAMKNPVIMVYFALFASSVLGMISGGDRASVLEHASKYQKNDSSPVMIPSKWFVLDSCAIHNIPFNASAQTTF
jgi:hypothetical protein